MEKIEMEKLSPIVETYKTPEHWILEKKEEMVLHIPNVKYAKQNNLLETSSKMSIEIMINNMNLCGFEIVSIGAISGVRSKITTKCCNVDCNDTCEKTYHVYITNETLPLCQSCARFKRSINRNKDSKRLIVAIRGSEKIEFHSISDVGRKFNMTDQNVYNYLRKCNIHNSGYRFKYVD
ncbi:hypothetical protein COJ17_09590 [Bacillus thuringiensis]|nr:hypothetical protein CN444_11540 [Bacillus thuringiensis]PFK13285.1 hypothetical protein COJ17_09590 [Bacillus thuringiensis]